MFALSTAARNSTGVRTVNTGEVYVEAGSSSGISAVASEEVGDSCITLFMRRIGVSGRFM